MAKLAQRVCQGCGAPLAGDELTCGYCGSGHVFAEGVGLQLACRACGVANRPDAKHCVQCAASLHVRCPECHAHSPLGSRYCQDCRIDFRSYRDPVIGQVPCRMDREAAEGRALEWLNSRWFKARDLERELRFLEATLFWLPAWTFESDVAGHAQGQQSQTHYRTVSNSTYRRNPDGEGGEWVEEVGSEPYTVWTPASKDFEQRVQRVRVDVPAEAGELASVLTDVARARSAARSCEGPLGGREGERVFEPVTGEARAWATLRKATFDELRATLLDKVERLEVRYLQPRLHLTFFPVWEFLYRYRRGSGRLRVNAHSGEAAGQKVTLLSQWFG